MKQSVTNIRFEYLKCCLVLLEELGYLNTLLFCKRTAFCEKEVVVWMKVMPCFSVKMTITNSISCLHCLDGSDISYIAYIFCIFASVSVFQ